MPLGEVGPADLPGRSGRGLEGLEEVWGRSGSGLGEVGPADLPARAGKWLWGDQPLMSGGDHFLVTSVT